MRHDVCHGNRMRIDAGCSHFQHDVAIRQHSDRSSCRIVSLEHDEKAHMSIAHEPSRLGDIRISGDRYDFPLAVLIDAHKRILIRDPNATVCSYYTPWLPHHSQTPKPCSSRTHEAFADMRSRENP